MEEHAVPQDITGFKFKLIGDMTVKQFGELAFGAICAYVVYASGLYPLFKWPLVVFFASFGVALAFLPISERPLDVWLTNFFRAIYRPTYYVWKKEPGARVISEADFMPGFVASASNEVTRAQTTTTVQPWPYSPQKKTEPTANAPRGPQEPQKKAEPQEVTAKVTNSQELKPGEGGKILSVEELLKQRQSLTPPPTVSSGTTNPGTPTPTSGQTQSTSPQKPAETTIPFTVDQLVALRQQKQTSNEQITTQTLSEGERQITEQANQVKELMIKIDELKNKIALDPKANQETLAKELTELLEKRSQAAEKLSALRKQVSDTRVSAVAVPEYKEPVKSPAKVRVVPKTVPQQAPTIKLTDLPNVINGLVTDPFDKPLESAILVIKDQAGNSIRAFKTNKIGQFIVSTPMQNGTYILELEKSGFNFDTLEVTLNGQVLAPITIKANNGATLPQGSVQT
jgi:gas vesicle protein